MAEPQEEQFLDDIDAPEEDIDLAEGIGEDVDTSPEGVITALTEERDQLRDRLLRVMADSENLRKRAERDRREAEHYGGTRLARDLLPVYDNLNRALSAVGDEQRDVAGSVIEGIELTLRELLNVFSKHGVTVVKPEEGDQFDPQMHQAMFEAPVPGTTAGQIIQVMTEGFLLHDRLLRPAQVGVSSTPKSYSFINAFRS